MINKLIEEISNNNKEQSVGDINRLFKANSFKLSEVSKEPLIIAVNDEITGKNICLISSKYSKNCIESLVNILLFKAKEYGIKYYLCEIIELLANVGILKVVKFERFSI